jgi:hypothetical protein
MLAARSDGGLSELIEVFNDRNKDALEDLVNGGDRA